MSTLRTNALEGVDAKNSITIVAGAGNVTTTNVQEGLAKVWAAVFYSSGTPTVSDSFNVSSLNDDGTGDYDANFTSNMGSANYGAGAIAIFNTRVATFASTDASLFNIKVYDISVGATSASDSSSRFTIHGDLA